MAKAFKKRDTFSSTCIFTGGRHNYAVIERMGDSLICEYCASEADGIHKNQETFQIHKDGEREYLILWEYKGKQGLLYADELAGVLDNSSEPQEIRKVYFGCGMSSDFMLILTDAPKSAIEDWAREYNKGLEDNNNVYFKPLQRNYYVKIIADSEVNDLSWDDIEAIGYDESYDLGDYMPEEDDESKNLNDEDGTKEPEMSDRELAVILCNMQLDMDYGDVKPYGKQTIDMLEEEIAILRCKDSSLYYVLENIARKNSHVSILIDGTEEE